MAESSTTPADPRAEADTIAMRSAGAFRQSVEPELRVSKLYALNLATKVVTALSDAGFLSLPEREAETDPDVLAVLQYVSTGRGYVDVEPYPDTAARRALGRIHTEQTGTPTRHVPPTSPRAQARASYPEESR